MNLILLTPADFESFENFERTGSPGLVTERVVRLSDRRLTHIREVHRAQTGDELVIGLEGGNIGRGTLLSLDETEARLEVTLDQPPPPPLDLTLVLALPRPRVLKRCLESAASLGVKRIILINAWRVEKSYWQTPVLKPETVRHHLGLGLEQARDTVLPSVRQAKLFKPFVEDDLPAICENARALVAHPSQDAKHADEVASGSPTVLCIGPEGGWLPYEVDKLIEAGCDPMHLGPRILRVEVALPTLIAKLL